MAASIDDELLLDAEDDARTVAYIRRHLTQEESECFSEDDLYYILDLIVEYYTTSGVLDAEPDKDGYIDIDETAIADFIVKQARKEKQGTWPLEAIMHVVELEGEYAATESDSNS